MRRLLTLAITLWSLSAIGQNIIQIPLSLTQTNPFVWTNAVWWTNTYYTNAAMFTNELWWTNSGWETSAPSGLQSWQGWWAVKENLRRITNTLATTLTPSNVLFTTPLWRDQIISGMALGFGASTPGVVAVSGGFIRGLGFAHGEDAHAAAQLNHDIAPTNAALPDFYLGPHIHISPTDLSAGTNATFRLVYQWANINEVYTNVIGTNTATISFTNLYEHRIMSFGYITNNAAQGSISTIFRFGLERQDGGDGDMGDTRCVIVDSVDIHYPVWRIGSASPSSD